MCVPGTALSRYINFYTDFAFKKIFGTEANKDLLISFLNSLLDLHGDDEITDLTQINTEQLSDSPSDRRAVFDVNCQTAKGERFVVEMQKAKQDNFRDRAVYYSSFPIREQGIKGSGWDYTLSPIYVVGILNFVMDENKKSDKVVTRALIKDDDNEVFSNKLNFIFLEMPKFRKKEDELKTLFDKWLFVIKNLYKLTQKPKALSEAVFHHLFEIAEIAAFTPQERYDYEESLKNFRDMNNVLQTAIRQGYAEGEAIGLEKGKAEGEHKEKLRSAKKMLDKGIDVQTVAEITGLSVEEIKRL